MPSTRPYHVGGRLEVGDVEDEVVDALDGEGHPSEYHQPARSAAAAADAPASSSADSCGFLRYSARMATADTTRELLGEERRELILRWLAAEGKVRASDLALRLRVSLDTVRRDLQELSDAGLLRRVHGGALPPSPPGPDSFVERLPDDVAAKAAVAQAAVGLIRAGRGRRHQRAAPRRSSSRGGCPRTSRPRSSPPTLTSRWRSPTTRA